MRTVWEYLIVDHPHRDRLQAELDAKGRDGWELTNSGYEGGTGHVLIYKRPIVEPPAEPPFEPNRSKGSV